MNICTFNPETLNTNEGVVGCPLCGMLVFPGRPHPSHQQPLSDTDLEKLALSSSTDEVWINRYLTEIPGKPVEEQLPQTD